MKSYNNNDNDNDTNNNNEVKRDLNDVRMLILLTYRPERQI